MGMEYRGQAGNPLIAQPSRFSEGSPKDPPPSPRQHQTHPRFYTEAPLHAQKLAHPFPNLLQHTLKGQ